MGAEAVQILNMLIENGRISYTDIAKEVGMKPPSVIDRIKKMESDGLIYDYTARVDYRKMGFDMVAFVGVVMDNPVYIDDFENANGFTAQIGQTIWLTVEKNDSSFEVSWTGGNVRTLISGTYYYVISYDDLANGAITLTPRIDYTECEVTITFGMTNGDSASETSYAAEVSYVDTEGNSVRVIISMFGKETPVELELDQVETVKE